MLRYPLLCFFLLFPSVLPAQEVHPIKVQELKTIAPEDSSFEDLLFLKSIVKNKQIILLGEPNHGEGNSFLAYTRIIRFLVEHCGYQILAFESGFYDLYKAQESIQKGEDFEEVIEQSIYPIWSHIQQFQPLLKYIYQHQIQIAGFDPQIGEVWAQDFLDDLQDSLEKLGEDEKINWDYLQEILEEMEVNFQVPDRYDPLALKILFQKIQNRLKKLSDVEPESKIAYYRQALHNIQKMAQDYHKSNPAAKDEATFQAKDAHARDRLMAENILFLKEQYPEQKIICWGVAPHFAHRTDQLENEKLKAFTPSGKLLKKVLGDQVYSLALIGGKGKYFSLSSGTVKPLSPALPGSLEASLLRQNLNYAIIESARNPSLDSLVISVIELSPLKGNWTQVFDAYVYLRDLSPVKYLDAIDVDFDPLLRNGKTEADQEKDISWVDSSFLAKEIKRQFFSRAKPSAEALRVEGYLLQEENQQAIAFATITLRDQGVISDENGYFTLPLPSDRQNDTLMIHCLGYESKKVKISDLLSSPSPKIYLKTKTFELPTFTLRSEALTAEGILRKCLNSLPKNYAGETYNAEYFVNYRVWQDDQLYYDVDYVNESSLKKGYLNRDRYFERRSEVKGIRRKLFTPNHLSVAFSKKNSNSIPIFTFKKKGIYSLSNLKHFDLRLELGETPGQDTVFIIHFQALKQKEKVTGNPWSKAFGGTLYIHAEDYAILRSDFWGESDILPYNKATEKGFLDAGYTTMKERAQHFYRRTYFYEKRQGLYFVTFAQHEQQESGILWGSEEFSSIKVKELFHLQKVDIKPTRLVEGNDWDLHEIVEDPAFWENYPLNLSPKRKYIQD